MGRQRIALHYPSPPSIAAAAIASLRRAVAAAAAAAVFLALACARPSSGHLPLYRRGGAWARRVVVVACARARAHLLHHDA